MNAYEKHCIIGAHMVANNPDKIQSTGDDTAKVDSEFAQNFFQMMQLDYGQYAGNSNGTDFAVSVIDKELETLNNYLDQGAPMYKASIANTMIGMLEAFKTGDTDGDGAVSATEMNALLADGGLSIQT